MPFIERSVAWLVSHFGVGTGTPVADFGCGPGLYTTRLAAAGAEVTGIDFSVRSIAHARAVAEERGLEIEYVLGNYLTFESDKRFDLMVMIMCDFCALGPVQRRTMLDTFRAHLTPDGSVVFDVYGPSAFDAREESATYAKDLLGGFFSDRPYYGFLNTFKYEAEQVTLDKYTVVEGTRTRTIYNWLQCFSPEALAGEIEASGLAVRELLGDVAGEPFDPAASEFAVVAGRPVGPS
jgi:cyclopropane fatty-acyl-phospholipid synthase-like methyltransferase